MPGPSLTFSLERPDSTDAKALIRELDADLEQRYPREWIHGLHPEDIVDPELIFVVARLESGPVGCGGLRRLGPDQAEVKRMYVAPRFRGKGYSRQILVFLEATAKRSGYTKLLLETGSEQPEAIGLYRSAGYREIPLYGEYRENPYSVCFEKQIA
jgi:putative acetyltransferase